MVQKVNRHVLRGVSSERKKRHFNYFVLLSLIWCLALLNDVIVVSAAEAQESALSNKESTGDWLSPLKTYYWLLLVFAAGVGAAIVALAVRIRVYYRFDELKKYCAEELAKQIKSGQIDLGLDQRFREMDGVIQSAVSLCLARPSYNPETYEILRSDLYELAITHAEGAYAKLNKCDSSRKWQVANNLAFWYSLGGKAQHAAESVRIVRALRENAEEFAKPWVRSTFAAVVVAYPRHFERREAEYALDLTQEISKDPAQKEILRKAAALHASHLEKLLVNWKA
jgi:hypothetical protein